ncbi:hypothetical protein Poli38472_002790 [Pythium oligandrum]|uniref:Uncharacterized protein n=1 Tax=Pythium oligandrum TaxID=41045 RepID=A0A8K1CHT8_PYTOL|nr:hypothetical protein Poli38472_002790 [Pythium oligandrum]|eukprot:TMW63849.1 hypothetical protein Poli38472_002790 [Pythium oligandrum]
MEETKLQKRLERSSSSYITLTPRSNDTTSPAPASLAKEILSRKWEASKKKEGKDKERESKEAKELVEKEKETNDSPTETDQSSDAGMEATESERGDDEDVETEAEDSFGVFPTYVCELHDPKAVLKAEHVRSNRVEISLVNAPISIKDKDKRMWGWHSNNTFRYEISVGLGRTVFDCTPSKVLDVLKNLTRDNIIAEQIQLVETNYFRDGLLGSIKRLYPSAAKLSDEIVEVLESISDIDSVLVHPAYLQLIGVTKGTVFHNEIESLVTSHRAPATSAAESTKCMCDTYQKSVDRFGELYKQQEEADGRFSVVASESLMWSRGILSFYTDTIYTLDKRDFRPWRGLNKCIIYGFGRRRLFEIVRTSRKEWAFRHHSYGTLATLSLERYMYQMSSLPMVAITRRIPDVTTGSMREESVCFVKKSKKVGYRCLLMSEVISRGRVTTSLSIEHATSPQDSQHCHYMTMSEISGTARESVCSSTLSVPLNHHKHCQQLHISGGSDVVTFLAIAASYDVLVGGWTYWTERRY